ncbi:unnamed protein product [Cuscuta epithymum]|uniref:Ty3 transposon capsid-like protein domain-containing protein n=1 Tax=Cuscuta epithymum TaxID=186058 RepID=A0AAV0C4G4_9ASTE|nr:unnamed protein product [Cuscuta epithymum]
MDRNQQQTTEMLAAIMARLDAKDHRSRSRSHRSSALHRSSASHRTSASHHTSQQHQSRHKHAKKGDSSDGSDSSTSHSTPRHNHDPHRNQRHHHHTGRKIDMPIFNGEDVCGWLLRMNCYFRLNNTEEEDKIDVAVVAMEDQALSWFQWWEGQAHRQTWESFTAALTKRFQPNLVQDPLGPLLSLKQKGSVKEYRDKFETAIASQGHLTEEVLKGVFIKGLKKDIRAELKLHTTRTLAKVMDTTSLIENKNNEVWIKKNKDEGKKRWPGKAGNEGHLQNGGDNSRWRSSPITTTSAGKIINEIKPMDMEEESANYAHKKISPRLTQHELQEMSRKGLCFKCGENWNRGQICKMKHYKFVFVEDSGGEKETECVRKDNEEEDETEMEVRTLQLSPISKEEIPSMKTFKMKGELKWKSEEKKVEILIDTGASHNFISQEFVRKWELSYRMIRRYSVQIGNGDQITNNRMCEGLELELQGLKIQQPYYMLEWRGTDMVLDMDWLTSLGDTEINFQNQTIKVEVQGQKVIIHGDPSFSQLGIYKEMKSLVNRNGGGKLLSYQGLPTDIEEESVQKQEVAPSML